MRICVSQLNIFSQVRKALDWVFYLIDDDGGGGQVILPCHVAVAVEGVGDEVEAGQARQLVECSRSDTADEVTIQWQTLKIVQTTEHCSVHALDLVLRKQSARESQLETMNTMNADSYELFAEVVS